MVNVCWHTNLDDVMRYEKFPLSLTYRPQVGDLVRSLTMHGRYKRRLELKVYSCTITNENCMEVELHLTGRMGQTTVSEFEKHYRNFRSGD